MNSISQDSPFDLLRVQLDLECKGFNEKGSEETWNVEEPSNTMTGWRRIRFPRVVPWSAQSVHLEHL